MIEEITQTIIDDKGIEMLVCFDIKRADANPYGKEPDHDLIIVKGIELVIEGEGIVITDSLSSKQMMAIIDILEY